MVAIRREHSGNAPQTSLTGSGLPAGVLSFTFADGTGYPTGSVGPFVITVNAGKADEEKVLCSARTGTTVTVAASGRGYDGTANQTHAAGATITHTFSALEADEANAHVMATTGVHGATGAVVGTTDAQVLTNKTLTSPVINTPTGDVATKTGTETLSNKTLAAPVLSGITTLGSGSGRVDATGILVGTGCWGSWAINNAQSVASGTWTPLDKLPNTATQNAIGGVTVGLVHGSGTDVGLTVPKAGLYLVSASIQWDVTNATGVRVGAIIKNSAGTYTGRSDAKTVVYNTQTVVSVQDTATNTMSTLVSLAAGDYLELWGFQTSGVALNAFGTANANMTFLNVTLISAAT